MRPIRLLFACAVASFVWGCGIGGTSWSFRRARGEVERPALTTAGIRVFAGDVERVQHTSGAVILGEIEVGGGSFGDVRQRAAVESAKLGGTHFTLLSKWTEGKFSTPYAVYVVIRVPEEAWAKLPDGLRPTPRRSPDAEARSQ